MPNDGGNKKKKQGVMYSTNPNFEFEYENQKTQTLSNNAQHLRSMH